MLLFKSNLNLLTLHHTLAIVKNIVDSLTFSLLFIFQALLDFRRGMQRTLAHAGTTGGHLCAPHPGLHVLHPEWPGMALVRARLINPALIHLQEGTVPVRVLQVKEPVSFVTVVVGELPGEDFEVSGQPLALKERYIHIPVIASCAATVATALTLELDPVLKDLSMNATHVSTVAIKPSEVQV